jgi:hypothetical protein
MGFLPYHQIPEVLNTLYGNCETPIICECAKRIVEQVKTMAFVIHHSSFEHERALVDAEEGSKIGK